MTKTFHKYDVVKLKSSPWLFSTENPLLLNGRVAIEANEEGVFTVLAHGKVELQKLDEMQLGSPPVSYVSVDYVDEWLWNKKIEEAFQGLDLLVKIYLFHMQDDEFWTEQVSPELLKEIHYRAEKYLRDKM